MIVTNLPLPTGEQGADLQTPRDQQNLRTGKVEHHLVAGEGTEIG